MSGMESAGYLPLRPLLDELVRLGRPTVVPTRANAVSEAAGWLRPEKFSAVPQADFVQHLARFAAYVDPFHWHAHRITVQAGFLRHGMTHLTAGQDQLAVRFRRCADPNGAYAVVGAGRGFWAAALKATDPDHLPDWTPAVERGLERCGVFGASERMATAIEVYAELRAEHPALTADDLDRFFERVGRMRGRELPADEPAEADAVRGFVRAVRVVNPLRRRLAEVGERLAEAKRLFRRGLDGDAPADVAEAVALVGGPKLPFDLGRVRRLLDAGPESSEFDEFAGLGLTAATALLHLHDPKAYPLWLGDLAAGLAALDDAFHPALPPQTRYALFRDVAAGLRERFGVHPFEAAEVIAAAADRPTPPPRDHAFRGLAAGTFAFFRDLTDHNDKQWMDLQRERYQFFAREPMAELCEALAERYVRPVLAAEYGWDLETDPRPGRAVTSITKNDYGRSEPYLPELWVTFYRRTTGGKRHDAQLFVKADAGGVAFGFRLGRSARDAGRRFRKAVQDHGELLHRAVRASGAADGFVFRNESGEVVIRTPADLREWAVGKELVAEKRFATDHPTLRTDDLVGEVLIAFDRLVPLFAAAVEDDPRAVLTKRAGETADAPPFDRDSFTQATFLSDTWLSRALDLLAGKKQLILHGVPGTGKTHVARCLARVLTADRPGAVRLVQFHPAYGYEEFVEGIRPRSVDAAGGTQVTYPVEDGVLAEFAAHAEAQPAVPHVLLIDEINRGNLPRIFGELLFLLEYRDQAVTLPHSRRAFRLPANLYLIGTMNTADRSTVALDQALRRRFSFVEMPADPAVLAGWLDANSVPLAPRAGDLVNRGSQPAGGVNTQAAHAAGSPAPLAERAEHDPDTFGPRVVRLFEELNRRLARDLGPDKQVGHSFFMVPGLTEAHLRTVWDHHVAPLLGDYFAPRGIPAGYDLDKLLNPRPRRAAETAPS